MWEDLTKGETLNYWEKTFQIYWCNGAFNSNDQQFIISVAKSKVILFKKARTWAGFTLQIMHLVRTFIFKIISTLCAHHTEHYVLQTYTSFEPK